MTTPPDASLHGSEMLYIIGAPGAGKGTLCSKLAQDLSKTGICLHLSVGEHLRDLRTPGKQQLADRFRGGLSYEELKRYIDRRELVPAVNIVRIVKAWYEMYRPDAQDVKVLVDGFPRDLETAELAEREFGPPHRVLFFHCPEDIARQRFLVRKRSKDDDDAMFSKRYNEFAALNEAIMEHYKDGRLIMIDTSGETEKSYRLLQEEMQKKLASKSESDRSTEPAESQKH